MARKGQLSIQDVLESNEDFEQYLETNNHLIICMEMYSDFCGYCTALSAAVKKGKLELGQEKVVMARACTDKIDALARFRGKSEPCFIFIVKGKLTRIIYGANQMELCRVVEEEVDLYYKELATGQQLRPLFDIEELTPQEEQRIQAETEAEAEHIEALNRLRTLTLAARKKRVNERLAVQVKRLNFILFWPHCHQAHYDLYEKWDYVNINVAAKETVQLNENSIKEALYMSDIDPNEACVHALMNGEALAVLFKMFDTDNRDFCNVLRFSLYEEIPTPKEDVPPEKQVPPIPAFERYASISKTKREVRRDRYNEKVAKKLEEKEQRERLEREKARIEREAEEERVKAEKQKADEERMARMQAGLPAEPEPEEQKAVDEEAVEGEHVEGEEKEQEGGDEEVKGEEEVLEEAEKVEEEEEFHSDVSVEGEDYIPPGGLFVPGLYSPPNDLAKANALALFFPKIISKMVQVMESEILPPHVLIMVNVDKRFEIMEVIKTYKNEILNFGFFTGDEPYQTEFVAFTLKQYEKMERKIKYKDRIALMVSRKRSLPMLQLVSFNPIYISLDTEAGEKECLHMFPVGYGDEYVDEESVVEEEIVEVVEEPAATEHAPEPEAPKGEEDEDEEEA